MSDTTFITNEETGNLKTRFETLIKDTKYFDCLVGYFYISGFHLIYKSLESTEKIRILVGIKANKKTHDIVAFAKKDLKEQHRNSVIEEISESTKFKDSLDSEDGVRTFLDWLKKGKMEIRIYESQNIHAKVYISTFKEGDRDIGRVITGSSNFTKSGLQENIEFNVELKNRSDYEFAQEKFEELWKKSIDLDKHCIDTLEQHTWLRKTTPYELYLKCLYEYFEKDLSQTDSVPEAPDGIDTPEYQKQAIINAKKIIEEYGGVFISDVVGLGKTYMASGLCKLLGGRTLVIAPPILTKEGIGSWKDILNLYGISNDVESLGQLEKIIENSKQYENVVIDEAHKFRNEYTQQYDHLRQICRNRRVILVTATPYNNRLTDIQSLIKLFHRITTSSIPGIYNLESYFSRLNSKLPRNRRKEPEEYRKISSKNAKEVREKVLKYLMIRRTRSDIKKYFQKDLESGNLKFPIVEKPKISYYKLDIDTDGLFHETIKTLVKEVTYARYSPLLELREEIKRQANIPDISQKNMKTLMKVLLVKRLDSSFYAFKISINKFIDYYEKFIRTYESGKVYVSKEYSNKIFQFIEGENWERIEQLLEEGDAEEYNSEDFKPDFKDKLYRDLKLLKDLQSKWKNINDDPKIQELKTLLKNNVDYKIILFTEFRDTASYIFENLKNEENIKPLFFHGSISQEGRREMRLDFDANVEKKNQNNNYNLLITTDVLSEGINLHRSNTIVNYDIPWNPTKMIQRAGRINRINTSFDKIYIHNFFPTKQSNDIIKLKESAQTKVESFLKLLGGDSYILTEDESIGSHELFTKLTNFEEEESENPELEHYKVIENIRDNEQEVFQKIKNLPKKLRTSKKKAYENYENFLITFFKKKNMKKFFISDNNLSKELDFLQAVNVLKSNSNEKIQNIIQHIFYDLLQKNKDKFSNLFDSENVTSSSGQNLENKTLKILKFCRQEFQGFTETNEEYLNKVIKSIEERNVSKHSLQKTHKGLSSLDLDVQNTSNTKKLLEILQINIGEPSLVDNKEISEDKNDTKKEVILSLYGQS